MAISEIKYRQFIGNENLFFKLREGFINSSLPNAIIIYGDKGIGKSTFIKFFIKSLFNNFSKTLDKV